ncbi:MAG: NADH-ubiquinone oxidoreductase subunit NDUFA12 family protein [Wolbachia endosymbiont of Tyrophagus putrescentiae]|nr:NADH-ubiquinone oxidoreductase subunit NDUFA12 family protein [Wolbachia endosymbiont of Tyrophagus putrescentiae]
MLSKISNLSRIICGWRKGKFVGKDENGNLYYESSKGKRWVIYNRIYEPTTVPPEWHIWLHYSNDTIPDSKKRRKKHVPNLTGTKNAYYPNQKVENHYESWDPDK